MESFQGPWRSSLKGFLCAMPQRGTRANPTSDDLQRDGLARGESSCLCPCASWRKGPSAKAIEVEDVGTHFGGRRILPDQRSFHSTKRHWFLRSSRPRRPARQKQRPRPSSRDRRKDVGFDETKILVRGRPCWKRPPSISGANTFEGRSVLRRARGVPCSPPPNGLPCDREGCCIFGGPNALGHSFVPVMGSVPRSKPTLPNRPGRNLFPGRDARPKGNKVGRGKVDAAVGTGGIQGSRMDRSRYRRNWRKVGRQFRRGLPRGRRCG